MKKILPFLILLFLGTGCSDDFVTADPEDFLSSEQFYKTQEDFNSAVISAYAKLQSQVPFYFEMSEWRSDNLDLNAPTAGTQDRYNIDKFEENSANAILSGAWANFYNGIFKCNVILDHLPAASFDETAKKQFEAEARFIRAMTYFNIVRYWGDAPLVTTVLTPQQALTVGRSPAAAVYELIEQDLVFASQHLPVSYPAAQFGRATSGAAKTLLGKVYLTLGRHAEASAVLTEVIGQYSLLPAVNNVFSPANETNAEIIFSIRFDKSRQEEGHALWFSVSDVSTSPITDKLNDAYSADDARKALITYQPVGNNFAPGKFVDTQSATTNAFGNDFIVLRYSDVLLMLAESLNEQGYQANGAAFGYLNQVRLRSGITALTAGDLPNQQSFRTAVTAERFLEFPLEGHRWFDLIRTGTAAEELAELDILIENYQLVYPVPQSEIEKIDNPNLFYQNEGY